MLVYDVKAFRYYSDLSGFDIVVVLENNPKEDVWKIRELLESIIETWHDSIDCEVFQTPIGDYIETELKKHGIEVSLYFGGCDDED